VRPVERAKAALRAEARHRRAGLDAAVRGRAAAAAGARLLALPEVAAARVVALYAAIGDELDPRSAVDAVAAAGCTVALPRVAGPDLDLVAVTPSTPVAPGHRGVLEPSGPPLPLAQVDVVVVPGLAFDRHGGRLGQGGGHYDRLLARLPPRTLRVGLCLDRQLVRAVPGAAHDQPVDVVVTESSTVRARRREHHEDPSG
jgi:5-formyltetrahydrofolate cyclo-ligase